MTRCPYPGPTRLALLVALVGAFTLVACGSKDPLLTQALVQDGVLAEAAHVIQTGKADLHD